MWGKATAAPRPWSRRRRERGVLRGLVRMDATPWRPSVEEHLGAGERGEAVGPGERLGGAGGGGALDARLGRLVQLLDQRRASVELAELVRGNGAGHLGRDGRGRGHPRGQEAVDRRGPIS